MNPTLSLPLNDLATPPEELPLIVGAVQLRKTARPELDRYFVYVPNKWRRRRTVVAVHGISRGAREQAQTFAAMAEQYRALVIAPLFDIDRYPDYQRLGRQGLGARADRTLQRVVADIERLLEVSITPFPLFGFSGGGQFAHRYALAHPQDVRRMVIAAAGWFTPPDDGKQFPMGTGRSPRLNDLRFDLDGLLRIPTLVVASRHDTERDATLRRRRRLDRSQGRNRWERARNWTRAMRRAARARGLRARCRFRELAHSNHDFSAAVRCDQLDRLAFEFLFDSRSRRLLLEADK